MIINVSADDPVTSVAKAINIHVISARTVCASAECYKAL